MLDLNASTEKDRDWHVANAKLRLQRLDGTFTDIDRATITTPDGAPLPAGHLPAYVYAKGESLRYNRAADDPTVFIAEL